MEEYKLSLNQNCAYTDLFFLKKIYIGSLSRPDVKDKVENAALTISIGGLGTDFNTGNFSYNIPTEKLVEVRSQNAASNHTLIMSLAPLKLRKSAICEV